MDQILRIVAAGIFALTLVSQFALPAGAVGLEDPEDTPYEEARALVQLERLEAAIRKLDEIVAEDPQNADALNLLGFSHRKLGHHDLAFDFYGRALAIEPRHLGANEYLGELYVELGQIDKARERLAILEDTCGQCEEYLDLAEAIDAKSSM